MQHPTSAASDDVRLTWAGQDDPVTWADGRLQWGPSAPVTLAETGRHGDGPATGRVVHGVGHDVLAHLADLEPGTARLVYMDPPYNTGRTFNAYRDREPRSLWLSMMRQVLTATRTLLRPDGSVWIHLDDREVGRVRMLADEIFGEDNFVADVVWERKHKPSFTHAQIAQVTDHILVYGADRSRLAAFSTGEKVEPRRVPLHNTGNTIGVLTFPAGSVELGSDRFIPAGDMSSDNVTTELLDGIEVVGGRNVAEFRMRGPFRWSQERLDAELDAGTVIRCARTPLRPNAITGSGGRTWTTLFTAATGMATNEAAREHSKALFGGDGFDTPKPEELVARIIRATTDPGDLVVDPFAGSGTTAAVAHKLGRSWLTVEASAAVLEGFTLRRLQAVIAGRDPRGASLEVTEQAAQSLPPGMSVRQSRLAAQWVAQLARTGAFDGADAASVTAVVEHLQTLASTSRTRLRYDGGGAFTTWRAAA
ncbi:site-specific DNA-methyltransferase [Cellulosimicrobium sp. Marseille-Q4280]|uniref:site-specific DNA-methyltransferase n=1 Tax=Cellulosimicrobium sp. Marseille-Q4280 TaxID=2937992 RepID=UPI002041E2C2|nr:site-specific DNA-methyltransferase [Cellulosimicrobium sp. Marseille-Q4280]